MSDGRDEIFEQDKAPLASEHADDSGPDASALAAAPPEQQVAGDDSDAVTRSAGRGAVWQVLGGGWQMAVQLGASAVLARLLVPSDFGLMGMALLFKGLIGRVGVLGSAAGVIAKRDVTQDDLSTAFWTSAGLQSVLFLLTVAGAPLAAAFWHEPKAMWVIWAAAVTFLFSGAASISGVLLAKDLRFGTLKAIEGATFALQSAAAIVLVVVFDMGYWALVISLLLSGAASATAKIVIARWRPSFRFSRASFRYMIRFGLNDMGLAITDYFHQNVDYILVGRILGGAGVLGLYEFAYRIPHLLLNRVSSPIAQLLFPTLSKANTSKDRLIAGYLKVARYVAILLFPALLGLAAVARPAVLVLWGEQWLAVIVPLQILCFRAALGSVLTASGAVFLCLNRPDIPFKFSLVTLAFTAAAVGGLGLAFGLVGVAVGMLISQAPGLILVWIAFRMTGQPIRRLWSGLAAPLVGGLATGAAALAAVQAVTALGANVFIQLPCGVVAGAAAYVGVLFARFPETVQDIRNTIRIVLGRKRSPAPKPA